MTSSPAFGAVGWMPNNDSSALDFALNVVGEVVNPSEKHKTRKNLDDVMDIQGSDALTSAPSGELHDQAIVAIGTGGPLMTSSAPSIADVSRASAFPNGNPLTHREYDVVGVTNPGRNATTSPTDNMAADSAPAATGSCEWESFTRLSLDDVYIDADFECCDVSFSPFQHDYDPLFDDTPPSSEWPSARSQWPRATSAWAPEHLPGAYDDFVSLLYKQRRLDLNASSPGYGFEMQCDPTRTMPCSQPPASFGHLLQDMASQAFYDTAQLPNEAGVYNLTQDTSADPDVTKTVGAELENATKEVTSQLKPETASTAKMTPASYSDCVTPKTHRTGSGGVQVYHGNELNGYSRACKEKHKEKEKCCQKNNNSNNFAETSETATPNDLNRVTSPGHRNEHMNVPHAEQAEMAGKCSGCGMFWIDCRCDPLLTSLRSLRREPPSPVRRPHFATATPGGTDHASPAGACARAQFVDLDRQVAPWSRWRSLAEEMLSMLPPLMTQARDVYIAKYARFKIGLS